jgi:hypothetical protein
LTDLGFRSTYAATKNEHSFFQYKIGSYKPDYYLYFSKEPLAIRYKNEIFNKIWEYNGFEVSKYLDFHYTSCLQKKEFLRFLNYETGERIKLKLAKALRAKLTFVLKWVEEGQAEFQTAPEKMKNGQDIKNGDFSEEGSQIYKDRFDMLPAGFEEKMEEVSKKFDNGKVQLVNSSHFPKLIQLFILLRDLSE